jgi:hypothetical protein
MASMFVLPIGLFLATVAWTAIVHCLRYLRRRRRQEIVRRGTHCEGKVVGILRPSLVDACTRLYVEFEPPGADRPLRLCHVDRDPAAQSRATLLRLGQIVSVCYLPDQPKAALISNLA